METPSQILVRGELYAEGSPALMIVFGSLGRATDRATRNGNASHFASCRRIRLSTDADSYAINNDDSCTAKGRRLARDSRLSHKARIVASPIAASNTQLPGLR